MGYVNKRKYDRYAKYAERVYGHDPDTRDAYLRRELDRQNSAYRKAKRRENRTREQVLAHADV